MPKLLIAALLLLLVAAVGFVYTPPALVAEPDSPALSDNFEQYLADREAVAAASYPLIPGIEKRIRWYDGVARTEFAIVNLHGFSGSRQGIAPLVDRAHSMLPLDIGASVLTLLSPDDQVFSPRATLAAMEQVNAPRKRIVEVRDVGDPSQHVLAGAILSPDDTEEVLTRIVEFVRANGPGG